jgi:hypothetical protein
MPESALRRIASAPGQEQMLHAEYLAKISTFLCVDHWSCNNFVGSIRDSSMNILISALSVLVLLNAEGTVCIAD